MGEKIAYVRVSTIEQNEERQVEMLEKYNIDKWFVDKASGKNTARKNLQRLREYVRENDTVYIVDWSRLSRSVENLLELINEFNQKNVQLVSIKENFDTSTSMGKLMVTVIGAIYEFQRAYILESQAEGIELAKKAGKYKGRKSMEIDNFSNVYNEWKSGTITAVSAAKTLGISRQTFYNKVRQKESKG